MLKGLFRLEFAWNLFSQVPGPRAVGSRVRAARLSVNQTNQRHLSELTNQSLHSNQTGSNSPVTY